VIRKLDEEDERGVRNCRADIHLVQSAGKGRCNDTERQHFFPIMAEKISLVLYREMTQKWGREEYFELCSRNERNGLI
jgi:hypothetical protein